MPPNRFESEVESFLEGSHGDRTHIKRADHHTVTPLCGTLLCVLSAKKFALRGLVVGVSAKKFALHAQNTPKSAFLRLLGELFRGWGVGGGVLGELFRAYRPHARPCGASGTLHIGDGGGFAALGAGCRRVAGVSHP